MSSQRSLRAWSGIHTWTSLICTAFLLLLCLTGLPLIFHDEIDAWTETAPRPATLDASVPDKPLDALVAAASARHPGQVVRTIGYDLDVPHQVKIGLVPSVDASPTLIHWLVADARTGKILDEPGPDHGVMHVMLILHTEMFAGLAGTLFLGLMGLLFVVATVSGVVLYAPFMRKLAFGTVRVSASPRVRWLDLHNVLGIVALVWLTVIGATGVMNTLSRPLFGLWTMKTLPPLLAPYAGKPLPTHLISPQKAVDDVRARLPRMEVTSIVYPTSQFGSPRHFVVWTRGREPVTSRLFTPVLAGAEDGKLVVPDGLPWYLRTLELSRPLHFGDYGGTGFKVVWALLDLATIGVLVTGLMLWWRRRRTGRVV